MKRRTAVAAACAVLAASLGSSASASKVRPDFWLEELPNQCGVNDPAAGRQGDAFWRSPDSKTPRKTRIALQASPYAGGGRWVTVRDQIPLAKGRATWPTAPLRKTYAYRTETYHESALGYVPVYLRGLITSTGRTTQVQEVKLDLVPPRVHLIEPSGIRPAVDGKTLIDDPITITAGTTTLRAQAVDLGAGFGQTVFVIMWFHDVEPGLWWIIENEVTGETTKVPSDAAGARELTATLDYDFAPGVYRISVRAEDCVGNSATSDAVRVVAVIGGLDTP